MATACVVQSPSEPKVKKMERRGKKRIIIKLFTETTMAIYVGFGIGYYSEYGTYEHRVPFFTNVIPEEFYSECLGSGDDAIIFLLIHELIKKNITYILSKRNPLPISMRLWNVTTSMFEMPCVKHFDIRMKRDPKYNMYDTMMVPTSSISEKDRSRSKSDLYNSSKLTSGISLTLGCYHEHTHGCFCNVNFVREQIYFAATNMYEYFESYAAFQQWHNYAMRISEFYALMAYWAINAKEYFGDFSLYQIVSSHGPQFDNIKKYLTFEKYVKHGRKFIVTKFVEKCKQYANAHFTTEAQKYFKMQYIYECHRNAKLLLECFSIYETRINRYMDHRDIYLHHTITINNLDRITNEVVDEIATDLDQILQDPNIKSKFNIWKEVTHFFPDTPTETSDDEIIYGLFGKSTKECSICCSLSIQIVMICCENSICMDCIQTHLQIPEHGVVTLFPKCPFCNQIMSDDGLALMRKKREYHTLRSKVKGMTYDELLTSFNKYHFSICNKCNHIIPTAKECERPLEELSSLCFDCQPDAVGCKRCPNPICGAYIERLDGCNDVKCICGTHMCWICSSALATSHDKSHFCYERTYWGKYCINSPP